MKKLIVLLIFSLNICSVFGQQKFVLIGKTSGFSENTWLYLNSVKEQAIVDSAKIINNMFEFRGEVNGPEQLVVSTKASGDRKSFKYKFIWIEPGTIHLTGEYNDFRNALISGSKLQKQQDELASLTKKIDERRDSLTEAFMTIAREDTVGRAKALALQSKLFKDKEEANIQFIKANPSYLVSAHTLTFVMKTIGKEKTKELYDGLAPEVKTSEYGVAAKNFVELNRQFNIGDMAQDIRLPDANGNVFNLSSYKGKYVLLDFWASGCGPCRMEHPELLELYNEYKGKGFEIFAVSLDENKKNWVKALEKDQIIWPNVSDLKGHNGETALTYGVYYIPNNFLLDREGKIIAKDIRGQALADKIRSIFEAIPTSSKN